MLTSPVNASNMLITTISQLIFKLMVKKKKLNLAQDFSPMDPDPATKLY